MSKLPPIVKNLIHSRAIDAIQEDYPDKYVTMAIKGTEYFGEEWTDQEKDTALKIWADALRDWERFYTDAWIEMMLHAETKPTKRFIPRIRPF